MVYANPVPLSTCSIRQEFMQILDNPWQSLYVFESAEYHIHTFDLPISPPAAIPPPNMSPRASSCDWSGTAEGVMPGGGAALGSCGSTITWDTEGVGSTGKERVVNHGCPDHCPDHSPELGKSCMFLSGWMERMMTLDMCGLEEV